MFEDNEVLQAALGKKITALRLTDDALHLELADGSKLKIADEGQRCCEERYMRTDDDLPHFVGSELRGVELRDAPDPNGNDGDAHEVQFLVVWTDRGALVCSSHNEHNGYYGGFEIRISSEEKGPVNA